MHLPSECVTLIYNPNAGLGNSKAIIAEVAAFWRRFDWDVTMQPTQYAGHARKLARAAAESGCGIVLAAGGDGTVSDVVNGIAHSETVLAVLPVGTANSFAKELGMLRPNALDPDRLLSASAALMRGNVQRMDVMRCDDGRYWLLWAGVGVDGNVVNYTEPRPPIFKRMGLPGYVVQAAPHVLGFEGVNGRVTVDEQTFEGDFVLINASNCRLFIGSLLHLNPQGVLDDGEIEVWLFEGRGLLTLAQHMLNISLEQHHGAPGVRYLRGRSFAVETTRPAPYQLDGEPAGSTPFACQMEQHAVRILTPNTATARQLFGLPGEPLR